MRSSRDFAHSPRLRGMAQVIIGFHPGNHSPEFAMRAVTGVAVEASIVANELAVKERFIVASHVCGKSLEPGKYVVFHLSPPGGKLRALR